MTRNDFCFYCSSQEHYPLSQLAAQYIYIYIYIYKPLLGHTRLSPAPHTCGVFLVGAGSDQQPGSPSSNHLPELQHWMAGLWTLLAHRSGIDSTFDYQHWSSRVSFRPQNFLNGCPPKRWGFFEILGIFQEIWSWNERKLPNQQFHALHLHVLFICNLHAERSIS